MGVTDPNSAEPRDGESSQDVDRVKSLQSQVDGVKDIMTQNVDRILARGERLDDLMGKSEDLQAGDFVSNFGTSFMWGYAYSDWLAQNFRHTSQKVARAYWWKNVKLMVVIIVIVIVIILIIIFLATGVIPTSGTAPKPLPTPPH